MYQLRTLEILYNKIKDKIPESAAKCINGAKGADDIRATIEWMIVNNQKRKKAHVAQSFMNCLLRELHRNHVIESYGSVHGKSFVVIREDDKLILIDNYGETEIDKIAEAIKVEEERDDN